MPRVTPEHLDARRRQILDGARQAFAAHGYEGATVRVLEAECGMSRGAIFHHFRDKDALFLALAEQDATAMVETVARDGLVQVMRELPQRDAGWLGVQLEVSARMRTDPQFRAAWQARLDRVDAAAVDRLARGQATARIRRDVDARTLVTFLRLVLDGLTLHLATGRPDADAGAVLDIVEDAVRPKRTPPAAPHDPDRPIPPDLDQTVAQTSPGGTA